MIIWTIKDIITITMLSLVSIFIIGAITYTYIKNFIMYIKGTITKKSKKSKASIVDRRITWIGDDISNINEERNKND